MKKKKLFAPKKICISHSYSDFDAIASTIAATKLYPGSVPILHSSTEDEVQRFLAIYRDYFHFFLIQDISFSEVEEVILTDTQDIEKIKPLWQECEKRKINLIIYDHHPIEKKTNPKKIFYKPYGSVMTLMYEKLKRNKISFNPIEATLFIIGIYEDTGSLTFPSTTPKDLEAAAFFLKNGARLSVISEFIFPPLQDKQKKLFTLLLESVHTYSIKGVQVAIAAVLFPSYVNGVSFLAHRLMDSIDVDALFVVVKCGSKTLLVARSEDENTLHIGNVMESVGGGGHPQAGSAFFKEDKKSIDDWTIYLLRLAKKGCKISKLVKDYMSSPVKVIHENATAEEALRIMLRYGHSGLPVTNSHKKIAGVVSRKDIERITDEVLLNRPIKAYMTKHVLSITPESSLKFAENLIVNKNIGRLPVIFDHKIVGILTRSDILRALYGFSKTASREKKQPISLPGRIHVNQLLESYLPNDHFKLIRSIGKTAESLEQRAFLVGGCVRDLLLNKPCKDYDFLIEGDALLLADTLQKTMQCRIIKNPEFHTAKILFGETEMDLASTRTEYYEHPAALPTVSSGSIREDLYRRDFTINALALSLETKRFGTLLDFYQGFDDLKHKKIRILHNLSFLEDPSRIFRAIVYALRYSFTIEEQTRESAINAMGSGLFVNSSRYRIVSGFIQMLSEPIDIVKAIRMVKDYKALSIISADIILTDTVLYSLNRSKKVIPSFTAPQWILYMILLTLPLPDEETNQICLRLKMSQKMIQMLHKIRQSYSNLDLQLKTLLKNSQIFEQLRTFTDNELLILLCLLSIHSRKKVLHYQNNLKHNKLFSTGEEIAKITKLEKKELGTCIKHLKNRKLDGFITTRSDELEALTTWKKE